MMNASLLILTLAFGADNVERPAVPQSGLAGLISSTTATPPTASDRAVVRESRRSRRATVDHRHSESLSGGRSNASQLIGLIQTTIEPDSWQAPVAAGGFGPAGGGGTSPRMQLIELIQESVEPWSWDVNGGPGSIGIFGQ